jgi:hypothetical protein
LASARFQTVVGAVVYVILGLVEQGLEPPKIHWIDA